MLRKNLRTLGLVTALSVSAVAPLSADEYDACLKSVVSYCDDALEDAKWYERIAVGTFCASMVVGCSFATSAV